MDIGNVVIINLLNGVSLGMLLFLIASGLSLVLGVMGIINLAHGSLYMLGTYIGLTIAVSQGGNFWLAALLGGFGAGLFGFILERMFLSRLYKKPNEQVVLTLGFIYIFANVVLWIWGASSRPGIPPPLLATSVSIGDIQFPIYRFMYILIGLLVAAGLWWMQDRTRVGASIRAAMHNKEMTMGLGINYGLICSVIFFLGAFLGGFAGSIGALVIPAQAEMGFSILFLAMIVVVVGGIGSVQGTLVGALVIGLVDTFGKAFFPDYAMFTVYVAFIIILLARPTGLLKGSLIS